MTKQEIREAFYDMLAFAEHDNVVPTHEANRFLKQALRRVCREFETYRKLKVLPVSEGENYHDLSDVKPSLDTDESVIRLLPDPEFMQGESGLITEITDSGGDALIASTAHGLSDGDIIELWNMSSDNYPETTYTVSNASTDSFKLTDLSYDTETSNGVWVKSSGYQKRHLQRLPFEEVEAMFWNIVEPSGAEVPRGTLFIEWSIKPDDLPSSGDLSESVVPEPYQEIIALYAAKRAMNSNALNDEIQEMRGNLYYDTKKTTPVQRSGRWAHQNGNYGFINRTKRAMIIYPGIL